MALLPLWFDVVNKRLVISMSNPDPWSLPPLYQEDIYSIQFTALQPTGNFTNPFIRRINLTGFALVISLGLAGAVYAQAGAGAWTLSADGNSLTGNLSLNTSNISNLTDGTSILFEIKLTDANGPLRFQQSVTIRKAVATAGALVPVAGDTALGLAEASRIFVRREGLAGQSQIFTSPDGTRRTELRQPDEGGFIIAPLG